MGRGGGRGRDESANLQQRRREGSVKGEVDGRGKRGEARKAGDHKSRQCLPYPRSARRITVS